METTKTTSLEQQIAQLQQQLHVQEKMASLGMLSAGIAHEIQNPLNFVINFSKMSERLLNDLNDLVTDCAEKLGEDDASELKDIATDLKENMQKIQEHGQRAISIIQGILLQSRGKENEFLPTDVCQLVHEYVWLSYHAMRANDKNFNISIHEEYQNDIPRLMVIPQDLSRAVLNVMNNACYTVREKSQQNPSDTTYTPTITIQVTTQDEQLNIRISDNGMGMTAETQEKLFHTFFTTKPVGQGTGLGMSITHDIIVNKHSGQILVQTEYGQGSTFIFQIPIRLK